MISKFLSFIHSGIFSLAIILTISVVGLVFPYGFPLYSIIIVYYFLYFLIKKNINLSLRIDLPFLVLYALIILYFFGLFFTFDHLYPFNIIDILGIIKLIMITFIASSIDGEIYYSVSKLYSCIISIIMPILGVFCLYKFYMLTSGYYIPFLIEANREYPTGTSLMVDYNMFSLGMFCGLIGIIYILKNSNSWIVQIYCYSSIIVILLAILLSGSRRAIILLLLFSIYIIYILIKKFDLNKRKKRAINYITPIIVIIGVLIIINLVPNLVDEITSSRQFINLQNRYSTLSNIEDTSESRTVLWEYSLNMVQEFNLFNLLLGNGFEYIPAIGNAFDKGGGYSYPHNLFLSTFLYSGAVGLFLLIILLLIPIIYFINLRKRMSTELILIYLVSLFYFSVSGNSFFSADLLVLSIILLLSGNKKDYFSMDYSLMKINRKLF